MAAFSRDGADIDLAGMWMYTLDGSSHTSGQLTLPGTLDTNGVGTPVAPSKVTDNLSRRFTFTGKATYSRYVDIPASAQGSTLLLTMERTRPSSVKVDGIDAGFRSNISSPQRYDLTPFLSPGRHLIEITVDNGDAIPAAVRNNSHACTESTQTNWNGILGEIALRILPPVRITDLSVVGRASQPELSVNGGSSQPELSVRGSLLRDSDEPLQLRLSTPYGQTTLDMPAGASDAFSLSLRLPESTPLWSEWNPATFPVELSLWDSRGELLDKVSTRTGIRDFKAVGTQFSINGNTTFLRGRHDACVAPITAHVPMDLDYWRRYFAIVKEYGLNHVRFHSWCPPEACFQAADEAGIYLQPELPIWGEIDKERAALLLFLEEDMEALLKEYAAHPSFVMFAIGNELWGDTSIMRDWFTHAREEVPGLLATYGSNVYLGWNGHMEDEDFLVTCRVGGGEGFSTHTRASFSFADADNGGIINTERPNTSSDFSNAISLSPVPVVGHEIGQYQSYPDYSTIEKYTGVLRPDNLVEFRNRADTAGTLRKSDRFLHASGAWATRLYKEEMEMMLRTPGMGGFQLLDLQDYPGQGTALVGILDPFMESKGFVSAADWRESCDSVTLLARLPQRCFTAGDITSFDIAVANYTPSDLSGRKIRWSLPFAEGETILPAGRGVLEAESVSIVIPEVEKASKMTLDLKSEDGSLHNSYDIWVYPREKRWVKGVKLTDSLDEALSLLERGDRVILFPDSATVAATTVGPLFMTDYWNYRMFKTICDNVHKEASPGTLGLLIDDSHPVFGNYPTSFHTDWQWWAVASNSRPLIIDRLPASVDPIVEPIDNVERNYRLALLLECNVVKGKLLVIMADMEKASQYPEGEWLLQSAREYMASKQCKPKLTLTPDQLTALLTRPSGRRLIREINNPSY